MSVNNRLGFFEYFAKKRVFLRASILFCFKRFSNINRRLRKCKNILCVNEIEKLRRTQ